jgi:hypothetical protein
MRLTLNPSDVNDYATFLRVKSLPVYSIRGREAWFPDEYAERLGISASESTSVVYLPSEFLFDYQSDIARMALSKRKFAVFAECGLGKSLIYFEYARTILAGEPNKGMLLFTPHNVVSQMAEEFERFYPHEQCDVIPSGKLGSWLRQCGGRFGITNYEALKSDLDRGQLGGIIADESSVMKSHYGNYAQQLIRLGKGLEWKLPGTGTPAPNDRIEYANHAVFLDQFPTVNSFLATYFVNRGQTQERWVLKKHALIPFYRSLSHWCIFLTSPSVYGWRDNTGDIPPIRIHVEEIEITESQRAALARETGAFFATQAGGITKRHKLSKIAKGLDGSETNKYRYIRSRVNSWPDESTIIWCWFNEEQEALERAFPDAASIKGCTKMESRESLIREFKSGERKVLISKPSVLGFGLNLQICTRQVFSSLIDSYEKFHQAVKRSNRIGSTKPLDVHIPIMDIERPMAENVLRKAAMIDADTKTQEQIFRIAQQGIGVEEAVELARQQRIHEEA